MTKRNGAARAIVTAVLTCAWAGGVQAAEGDWLVRTRCNEVERQSTTTVVPALGVKAEDRLFPEVDISYFFTPHTAELILTVPQKHDVELGAVNIGSVKHLPPTLTLQYHQLTAACGPMPARPELHPIGVVDAGSARRRRAADHGPQSWLGRPVGVTSGWRRNGSSTRCWVRKIDADIAVKGAGVPVTRLTSIRRCCQSAWLPLQSTARARGRRQASRRQPVIRGRGCRDERHLISCSRSFATAGTAARPVRARRWSG